MNIHLEGVDIFFDGVDHAECVAVHPDGSVWAGGEAGQIYRISADGKRMQEIANTGGFTLGIAFSPNADWLAVCDSKNVCIWKLHLHNNKLEKFADAANGEKIKIPNYAAFDAHGNLYVSDSGSASEACGKVFKFDANGNGVIWHQGPFKFTNGLALDADEKYLYAVCSWLPGVERIEINEDGTAGRREVFATLPHVCPDGLAFDDEGNLYVSCYTPNAIFKVSRQQEVTLFMEDWKAHTLSNPTNIAFGGKNFDELFTSNLGRWHISKIPMTVKGLKLPCHK